MGTLELHCQFCGAEKTFHANMEWCIRDQAKQIKELKESLKTVGNLHMSLIEEQTRQISTLIDLMERPTLGQYLFDKVFRNAR